MYLSIHFASFNGFEDLLRDEVVVCFVSRRHLNPWN